MLFSDMWVLQKHHQNIKPSKKREGYEVWCYSTILWGLSRNVTQNAEWKWEIVSPNKFQYFKLWVLHRVKEEQEKVQDFCTRKFRNVTTDRYGELPHLPQQSMPNVQLMDEEAPPKGESFHPEAAVPDCWNTPLWGPYLPSTDRKGHRAGCHKPSNDSSQGKPSPQVFSSSPICFFPHFPSAGLLFKGNHIVQRSSLSCSSIISRRGQVISMSWWQKKFLHLITVLKAPFCFP